VVTYFSIGASEVKKRKHNKNRKQEETGQNSDTKRAQTCLIGRRRNNASEGNSVEDCAKKSQGGERPSCTQGEKH